MEHLHTGQRIDEHTSVSAATRPAAPASSLVLTEDELGRVVGGVMQDSDPCEGGEGQ